MLEKRKPGLERHGQSQPRRPHEWDPEYVDKAFDDRIEIEANREEFEVVVKPGFGDEKRVVERLHSENGTRRVGYWQLCGWREFWGGASSIG